MGGKASASVYVALCAACGLLAISTTLYSIAENVDGITALYETVQVFATVGFGDTAPRYCPRSHHHNGALSFWNWFAWRNVQLQYVVVHEDHGTVGDMLNAVLRCVF